MRKWLVGILFLGAVLNSQEQPWLTGPLIAPVGRAVPYGDFLIQSYVFCTAREDFYSLNPQFRSFFGLTPWCDINIIPQFFYNTTSNQHSVHFGDLTVGLDFQLMADTQTPYFPGIKLAVREIFPTGNFQHLHPRKLGTDQTGDGTFATQFDLVFYKVFHLCNFHWLSTTFSAQYTINTPVHVHGFNTYGGGFGTNGTVLPGNNFRGIVSFELTLNQNWVLALDNVYSYTDPSQFYGIPGISLSGTYATVGQPSSEQFSMAPAIEYNLSRHFGIIAGCWFSLAGRNSVEFQSGVVNFAYAY